MLSAREDVHQGFADQFSVGVSNRLVRDFPYLTVGRTQAFADGIKLCAPTGNDGDGRRSGVDLSCGGCEFGGRVVGHAALVCDVGEDPSH